MTNPKLRRLKLLLVAPVSVALFAGSLVFLGRHFSDEIPAVKTYFASLDALEIAVLLAHATFVVVLSRCLWHGLMRQLVRSPIDLRTTLETLGVTNLGKYIPGKIWGYLWQVSLLKETPTVELLNANFAFNFHSASSALSLGCFAFALSGRPFAWVGWVVGFVFLTLPLSARAIALRIAPRWAGWFATSDFGSARAFGDVAKFVGLWCAYGLLAILALRIFDYSPSFSEGVRIIGATSASWFVGALAIYIPGGIGVTEASMYLSTDFLPETTRVALPILMRASLLAAETLTFVLALISISARKRAPRKP